MQETRITIELSEIEAERFVKFQKHYEKFTILEEAGVFNLLGGKAVIDFKDDGKVNDIYFDRIQKYRIGKGIHV